MLLRRECARVRGNRPRGRPRTRARAEADTAAPEPGWPPPRRIPHPALPARSEPAVGRELPFLPFLLELRAAGHRALRLPAGWLALAEAYRALPPVASRRRRPRSRTHT